MMFTEKMSREEIVREFDDDFRDIVSRTKGCIRNKWKDVRRMGKKETIDKYFSMTTKIHRNHYDIGARINKDKSIGIRYLISVVIVATIECSGGKQYMFSCDGNVLLFFYGHSIDRWKQRSGKDKADLINADFNFCIVRGDRENVIWMLIDEGMFIGCYDTDNIATIKTFVSYDMMYKRQRDAWNRRAEFNVDDSVFGKWDKMYLYNQNAKP